MASEAYHAEPGLEIDEAVLKRQCDRTGRTVRSEGLTYICIVGFLSPASADAFEPSMVEDIDAVFVDSPGGVVSQGLLIGRAVHSASVPVIVSGRCVSSCANYIAPAGSRLVVTPGSFVAFHGTPLRSLNEIRAHIEAAHGMGPNLDPMAGNAATELSRMDRAALDTMVDTAQAVAAEEIRFFRDIGIDEAWATSYNDRNAGARRRGPEPCWADNTLMVVLGPKHAAAFGVDVRGSWFPETRADYVPITQVLEGYSHVFDQDPAPVRNADGRWLDPDRCGLGIRPGPRP
jgi:hypothetical protein